MKLYGNLEEQKALAGLLYGMNPKTIVSHTAEEEITYGKAVFFNADKTAVKASKGNDGVYAGVAVFHQNSFMDSRGTYVAQEAVNVMEKGYIWVLLDADAEPAVAGKAYVTADGLFTSVDSTGNGEDKVDNIEVGVFKSVAEAGVGTDEKLALVALN